MIFSLPLTIKPQRLAKIRTIISEYFQFAGDSFSSGMNTTRQFNIRSLKKFFKRSPLLPAIVFGVIVVILLIGLVRMFTGNSGDNAVLSASGDKLQLQKPKAVQDINKQFSFPLTDSAGKEVSKLTYVIQKASIQDQIIVKGQRTSTVEERTFLIINLKITNDYKQNVQMNVRDYLRLTVNNNADEKLAPEIHNDPVEVQGISTKYTRVGFVINETDKNLTLQIGELNGPKESIKLNVK